MYSRQVAGINKHMPAPVKFVPGKDSLICYKHDYADMFHIKDGCRQKAKVKPLTAN